jgi:oligopeptide/dipeptide ABC transporter ATP-binding protein
VDEGSTPILKIRDLHVHYDSATGPVRAVDGVSLDLQRGETYALVGESGCGKTATALSVLRLVEPGRVVSGEILFEGRDLLQLSEKEMCGVRGNRIGMVFQEAAAALNPVLRVGAQVGESLRVHRGIGKKEALSEAVELLRAVRLADPERQARAYPHELSGGMKQRAMLAAAIACRPALLIADEPTTALDVTIQAQILELLRGLRDELGLTILLITHDLGVVAENADRVGVMYAGRLVEESPAGPLFRDPRHPYTRGLLASLPGASEASDGSRRLPSLPGSVPDPVKPPPGCRFHPRCPQVFDPCRDEEPAAIPTGEGRQAACFLYDGGER